MRFAILAMLPTAFGRLVFQKDEPGVDDTQVYKTHAAACNACMKHESYLKSPKHIKQASDNCSCHTIDINNVFASDATYEATGRSGTTAGSGQKGSHSAVDTSQNTGVAQLNSNFKWHCEEVHGAGKAAEYLECK